MISEALANGGALGGCCHCGHDVGSPLPHSGGREHRHCVTLKAGGSGGPGRVGDTGQRTLIDPRVLVCEDQPPPPHLPAPGGGDLVIFHLCAEMSWGPIPLTQKMNSSSIG